MYSRDGYVPGPWRLHPFYPNIVIADHPDPWRMDYNKEVFVARNANRLCDYNQIIDQYNMRRIIACFNFCKDYSNEELNRFSLLRILNNEPDKDCLRLHAQTPWEVDAYSDREVLSITRNKYHFSRHEFVVKSDWNYKFDEYITHHNCHRIVACVNFCEGYLESELDQINLSKVIANIEPEIY